MTPEQVRTLLLAQAIHEARQEADATHPRVIDRAALRQLAEQAYGTGLPAYLAYQAASGPDAVIALLDAFDVSEAQVAGLREAIPEDPDRFAPGTRRSSCYSCGRPRVLGRPAHLGHADGCKWLAARAAIGEVEG